MRSDAAGKFGEGALNVCTACYAARTGGETDLAWHVPSTPNRVLVGGRGGGPREANRPPPSPATGPINEREPNRAISIWPGRLFLAVTAVFVRSGESSLPPSPPLPEIGGSPGRW